MANVTGSHSTAAWSGTRSGAPEGASIIRASKPTTIQATTPRQYNEIAPGGRGWQQTMETSSNIGRSQISKGHLEFNITVFPMVYQTEILPLIVDVLRYNDDDDSVSVLMTIRTHGLVHANTAHDHMLTRGTIKQERRQVPYETFATDVEPMKTPYMYDTMFELQQKQFVDNMKEIWGSAHQRMLKHFELMCRNEMKTFATQYNLVETDSECRSMFQATYLICKRMPQDFVPAIMGALVEGLTARGFQMSPNLLGSILLVPRAAFVEKFANAVNEVGSLYDHRGNDQFTQYNTFRLENGEVISTATRTTAGVQVGSVRVVPFDEIQPEGQELPDAFFERRVLTSSVVVPRGVSEILLPTPQGKRILSPVDLAISAGMYYEDCCIDTSVFENPDTLINEDADSFYKSNSRYAYQPSPYVPSVGGSWALQTVAGATALCQWFRNILKTLNPKDLDELKSIIQRHANVNMKKIDLKLPAFQAWWNHTHKSLSKRLDIKTDNDAAMMCLLAILPGTRMVMSYLHSVAPFSICNFTLNIAGWANFADGYWIHPKPLTAISSDNAIARFKDPTHFGPEWYRILSRTAIFRNSMKPDFRLTNIYCNKLDFKLHELGTAWSMNRETRMEGDPNSFDAFAVFSGVGASYPQWCLYGPDSITTLPSAQGVNSLFTNEAPASAAFMTNMLRSGDWLTSVKTTVRDITRECPHEGWAPWPALLTRLDGSVTELKGFDQL